MGTNILVLRWGIECGVKIASQIKEAYALELTSTETTKQNLVEKAHLGGRVQTFIKARMLTALQSHPL